MLVVPVFSGVPLMSAVTLVFLAARSRRAARMTRPMLMLAREARSDINGVSRMRSMIRRRESGFLLRVLRVARLRRCLSVLRPGLMPVLHLHLQG
jgi:hypothetical protein